jgi:GTP-binding protein Era
VVFVDTPGLHEGTGRLGALMVKTAERALQDVDLVCLVLEATEKLERLDRAIFERLKGARVPVYAVLNKIDLVAPKSKLLALISACRAAFAFKEIVPVSAESGENCERLLALIVAAMPQRPPHFPRESLTDQPETFWVAETIREKIFRLTNQEVPYACAVRVAEISERKRPECLYIRASIFVERDSQKGILIGKGGATLKRIGTTAREDLERFFGIKVFLELTVAVRRNWRTDDRALKEFGFLLTS